MAIDLVLAAHTPLPESQNPAAVFLASLRPGPSRISQRSALRKLAGLVGRRLEEMPWHLLRYEHAAALRGKVIAAYAPATANRMLAALRAVLRNSWRLGYMSAEEFARAVDWKGARGSREPPGRMLTVEEVRRIEAAGGPRGAAVVTVLYFAGLRRHEVSAMRVSDYLEGGLRVIGKGDKERRVPLSAEARSRLERWLALREDDGSSLMFPGLHTPKHVGELVTALAKTAGVKATTHDFRRTWISMLLDRGDLSTAQKLAGHADPKTTSRYDRRGEKTKRDLVEQLPKLGDDDSPLGGHAK